MKDLFYQTSYGVGKTVRDDDIISIDSHLPENHKKWNNNKFTLFVFGGAIDPYKAKSVLFPCRDLIANLTCTYIGKERNCTLSGEMDNACKSVDTLFNGKNKELVLVEGIVDFNNKNVSDLISSLYDIVSEEVTGHFKASSDIAIYWYLGCDDYNKVKEIERWGSSVHFDDENCAVMMFL